MSLRKVILIVLLAAFNFSCSSKKLESDPNESRDIYGEDVWTKDPKNADKIHTTLISDEVAPTGSNFYINEGRDKMIEQALTPEQIQKMISSVRVFFAAKGFKEVKSPQEAHVSIFFGLQRVRGNPELNPELAEFMNQIIPDGIIASGYKTQITTHSKVVRDGVVVENSTVVKDAPSVERIYITGNMQTNGVRPKQFFAINIDFDEHTKARLTILEPTVKEYLNKIVIAAPAQPVSKKSPGCFPRFGFFTELGLEDGKPAFKVKQIMSKSPAEKSGLILGDVILAVDSGSYTEALVNKEIFEKQVPVPFKIGRGNEVLRKNIKPQIICGGY